MLKRFVSASAIAAIAIACGALALLLVAPAFKLQNTYVLAFIWCFVPLVWGVWAMLAPSYWVPNRLPNWGAILGLIAGMMAAFVIDIPERVLAQPTTMRMSGVLVLVAVALYYLLWMAVRAVYRRLTPTQPAEEQTLKTAA